MNEPMTIGRLAKSVGVHVQTIRYYERKKLLPSPRRREAGYRQYGPEDVQRLRFILRAKKVGFTLNDISVLLALRVNPRTGCEEVRTIAREALRHIEERMQELARFRSALNDLLAQCSGKGPSSDCPVLELLEKNS